MQDRVPTYPGRVKLTPVAGQTNTYDMERADAPTVDGTPLNKATFLTDATAALLGLSGDPTVNDAIAVLSARAKIASGSYIGTGTYGASNQTSIAFTFAPKILFLFRYVGSTGYLAGLPSISQSYPSVAVDVGAVIERLALTTAGYVPVNYSFGDTSRQLNFAFVNNEASWYSTSGDDEQFNSSGSVYYWVAIG